MENNGVRRITRALISVSDKTGIVAFAQALHGFGVEILSTGGTAQTLSAAGIPVRDVSDYTGFPEMMDGRIKTLHPKVHGGLLALRDKESHRAAMTGHGIEGIDLLAVTLYPFTQTVEKGSAFEDCIEQIDIGGPAMIRSAAKNHRFVTVITDPEEYGHVLEDMTGHEGGTGLPLRRRLAAKAFTHTAAYDRAIAQWFAEQDSAPETSPDMPACSSSPFPLHISLSGQLARTLRYGENPHQRAALYLEDSGTARPCIARAQTVQGKDMSYNNFNDTDAALGIVASFTDPAVVIVKHANPCGVATAGTPLEAYRAALRCDPVSAFGGIIALNRPLEDDLASEILKTFVEVIIAPEITADARARLQTKPNIRVLTTGSLPDPAARDFVFTQISGGFLVQDRDSGFVDAADLQIVTERAPTPQEHADLLFAFRVCKYVKSNAIVFAKNRATTGIGAGQMSRLDSVHIAARKAAEAGAQAGESAPLTAGSVVASDAFFPFADGLIAAAQAGASAAIQPGGSLRDKDVIAAANEHGMAMVFTGLRHFRH